MISEMTPPKYERNLGDLLEVIKGLNALSSDMVYRYDSDEEVLSVYSTNDAATPQNLSKEVLVTMMVLGVTYEFDGEFHNYYIDLS